MNYVFLKIFKPFLDQILPLKCSWCKKSGTSLCEACILKIRSAEREPARHIHAIFDYRDPCIKRAIWELKYKGKRNIAYVLGNVLYERMLEEISDMKTLSIGQPILVIPVPLSKKRLRERGYNQSELIAKSMSDAADEKVFEMDKDIIIKIKNTEPQARIVNRNKRLANIKGAFGFKNEEAMRKVTGRTIIVLDDVTTTGGTIHEIMSELKKAKTKKVVGFAVAH